jgi:Ca2+-binding EF-hand superfamily protein
MIVFDIIDDDDTGTITYQQFHNALTVERSPMV